MPGVQLFSDLCFFVVQRVPFRASLIKEIEHHGGRVVNLERQADQVIADHLRKDAPAGSLSYTWIHDSIKAGELQDLNLHQACRARPVSSARVIPSGTALSRPVKSTRTPFTVEDDIMLWNWVARHGGPKNFKGNEIYKKLEIENPRHTFQSWRDRYVKVLSVRPPPGVSANGPPTPPSEPPIPSEELHVEPSRATQSRAVRPSAQPGWVPQSRPGRSVPARPSTATQSTTGRFPLRFTKRDIDEIFEVAHSVELIPRKYWLEAWQNWAELDDSNRAEKGLQSRGHTAQDWADFYDHYARPEILRRQAANESSGRMDNTEPSMPQVDGAAASTLRNVARAVLPGSTGHAREPASPARQRVSLRQQQMDREARTQRIDALLEEARRESPLKRKRMTTPSSTLRFGGSEGQIRSPSINSSPARPATVGTSSARLPANATQIGSSSVRSSIVQRSSKLLPPIDLPTSMRVVPAQSPQESPSVRASLRHSTSVEPPVVRSIRTPRALTETNLAQMSKQQRASQSRANDLSEDDSAKDQSDFAEALQRMIPGDFLPDVLPEPGHGETEEIPESPPEFVGGMHSSSDIMSPELGSSPDPPAKRMRLPRDSSVPLTGDEDTPRQAYNIQRSESHQLLYVPSKAGRHVGSRNAWAQQDAPIASSPPVRSEVSEQSGVDSHVQIDLEVPEPEGGLYDHLSSEISEQMPGDPTKSRLNVNQDTQGIFVEETQEVDLSLPDLDELIANANDDRVDRRISDYLRHDTRAPSPIPLEVDDVELYITSKSEAGYAEDHIIRALKAGSMRIQPTETALRFLKDTGELPRGLAGIWNSKDDKDVESDDPARIAAVERQHGSREISRRLEFLARWRG